MTLRFSGGCLGGGFFYRLSSTGSVDGVPIDNPDQSIAQDIDKFTEKSSELFFVCLLTLVFRLQVLLLF